MPSLDASIFDPNPVAMRRLFALSCWLVAIIGVPLFFWAEQSERNFAWTIRPPVTAAFLGAAYFASFWVVFIGRRETFWAHARIGLPFAAVFAWLMLAATLLHLERFHLGPAFVPAARFMAWTWLVVYVGVPLLQAGLGLRQLTRPRRDPPVQAPMPAAYRILAALAGGGLAAWGIALFALPGLVAPRAWPWVLTPLTARAVAAWLVAWGIVAVHAAWEGDWRRARAGQAGLMVFGALELVVQWRFAAAIDGVGFAAVAALLFGLGAFGVVRSLREGPAPVYRYVDRWRVAGPIEEVATVLRDGESYPRWWPSVYLDVQVVAKGDARRIGEVGRVRAQGFLPYAIEFTARVSDERFPHGFSLVADGELQGHGEWIISTRGPWVEVEYHWAVSGHKALWRYTSFLLRGMFEANHHWTMRRGEESLRLELARRRAPTPEARSQIAAPPQPVRGFGDLLRACAELCFHAGPRGVLVVGHRELIRRPPHEVFAFFARVENDLLWQPEIAAVDVTSPGPMDVGSTFREVRRTLGQTFVWEMRVTAWAPGRHICIESERGTLPYRGCRELAEAPEGTWVTETSEVTLPWLMRPFAGWIGRGSRASVTSAYALLRRRLEAVEPAPARSGDSSRE